MTARTNLTRRQILKLLALTVGGSAMSGCWPCTRKPSVPCPTPPTLGSTVDAPLIIDAHCHIFNGSDLKVKDFFDKVAWNEKGVLAPVAEAVGAILQTLAWGGAPDGPDELKMLNRLAACQSDSKRQQLLTQHSQKKYQQAKSALLNTDALRRVPQKNTRTFAAAANSPAGMTKDDVLAEMRRRLQAPTRQSFFQEHATANALARSAMDKKQPLSMTAAARNFSLSGSLSYLEENFQYRFGAMQDYMKTFSYQGRGADLMVASMVDYDWWLSCGESPPTPLPQQVEVMAKISIVSGGLVHGFVPFDPLREVAFWAGEIPAGEHSVNFSSFELVQKAVSEQGCLGVKLYPPMGFAPIGNACFPLNFWQRKWLPEWMTKLVPSKRDGKLLPLGERLDAVLKTLYDWCVSNAVPIMAHSNATNGVVTDFAECVDPKYWKQVLDTWKTLQVSFGHLGGFSDPAVADQTRGQALIALMTDRTGQPGSRAYADSAYFAEVIDGNTSLRDRLLTALQAPPQGQAPILRQRLMYGTDWNLLINEGDIGQYLADFVTEFQSIDKATGFDCSDLFLGLNAASWLGPFSAGSNARRRLEHFYSTNGTDLGQAPPLWLKKIDKTKI